MRYLKRKLGITIHFLEIIKLQFGKKKPIHCFVFYNFFFHFFFFFFFFVNVAWNPVECTVEDTAGEGEGSSVVLLLQFCNLNLLFR